MNAFKPRIAIADIDIMIMRMGDLNGFQEIIPRTDFSLVTTVKFEIILLAVYVSWIWCCWISKML